MPRPITPPDTLLPACTGTRRPGVGAGARWPIFAVAASVVAVVGIRRTRRHPEHPRRTTTKSRFDDIASAHGLRDAARRLDGAGRQQQLGHGPITEISKPGVERFYLVGNDVPMPPEGSVYRVWLALR